VGSLEHQYPHREFLKSFVASYTDGDTQFSEGMIGPSLFALDFKTSVLCIVFFTAISCVPPAYLATNGPKTGMRQMVQARFALGCVQLIRQGGTTDEIQLWPGGDLRLAQLRHICWILVAYCHSRRTELESGFKLFDELDGGDRRDRHHLPPGEFFPR